MLVALKLSHLSVLSLRINIWIGNYITHLIYSSLNEVSVPKSAIIYNTRCGALLIQTWYHKWSLASVKMSNLLDITIKRFSFIADPVVTSLQRDKSADRFTLICTSTTSPATTVVWTKDGTTLSFDGTPYQHSQVVTNRQSSTYKNILTSSVHPASVVGYYTCTVSNSFGSSSRGVAVQGRFTDMVLIITLPLVMFIH